MSQLTPDNSYPDCLYLELSATPLQSEATDTQQIDLYLTLHFDEQWQPINGGRVKFGLKGGELKLRLENCQIPAELRHLNGSLELTAKESSQFQSTSLQALPGGTPTQPCWIFTGKRDGRVLQGSLQGVKLATLQVTDTPCRIEAQFTVLPPDIYLTGADGLWPHDISPNQLAILDRRLILYLIESKLQPYLSWTGLEYDTPQGAKNLSTPLVKTPTIALSELSDLIEKIVTAKTDNFLELAKIGGLNPTQDFEGAKLLGTNLRGIDLSGSNLGYTYLRGADLSDADLSGANLNQANLGGADLSGAYLSDADLRGADLHRSSLALANLSGADLSGANFTEANLSNANLSNTNLNGANFSGADLHHAGLMLANLTGVNWTGAKVAEARFGNNAGISEEMKQDLQQRGAIFEQNG